MALFVISVFASSASAFPIYNYSHSILEGTKFGLVEDIERKSDGTIYVADGGSVKQFNEKGEKFNQFSKAATGIAIYPLNENYAYVAGNAEVTKYNMTAGTQTSSFGTFGEGNGQFTKIGDIDADSKGNLWVIDWFNRRLQEFNSEGVYLRQINNGNWGGAGEFYPNGTIAIDSKDNVWVVNTDRLVGFTSEGKYIGELGAGRLSSGGSKYLDIDSKDDIWVNSSALEQEGEYYVVLNTKNELLARVGSEVVAGATFRPRAIAFDSNDNPWIYSQNSSDLGVQRWLAAPEVTTEGAASITGTEATVSAKVNPHGSETSYQFEYGTTTGYGAKAPASPQTIGSGNTAVAVGQAISGLKLGTSYHFRVVATSQGGTSYGSDRVFTTASEISNKTPPSVTPSAPTQGLLVTTNTGKWSGSPIAYSYQWQRCNATGGECKNIAGATERIYSPVEADVGLTLVSAVTASNAVNSVTLYTSPTGKVAPCCEITEYALPKGSAPTGVATQNANSVFFTNQGSSKLGKLSIATGALTEFELPAGSGPTDVTDGPYPGTYVWSTNLTTNTIRKTSYSGLYTAEFPLPGGSYPWGITSGPNGDLWFAEWGSDKIGTISTSGFLYEYSLPAGSDPMDITEGPDGNIWFVENGTSKIGKLTPAGAITEYKLPAGSSPTAIAVGNSETLWFTNLGTNKLGKITTSGTITEYALGSGAAPRGIVVGVDGRPWFTEAGAAKIATLDAGGTIRTYALPAKSEPYDIAKDETGILWFTNHGTSKVGRFVP